MMGKQYIKISDIRKDSEGKVLYTGQIWNHKQVMYYTQSIENTFAPIDSVKNGVLLLDPYIWYEKIGYNNINKNIDNVAYQSLSIKIDRYKNEIYNYLVEHIHVKKVNPTTITKKEVMELYNNITAILYEDITPQIQAYLKKNDLIDCLSHEINDIIDPIIDNKQIGRIESVIHTFQNRLSHGRYRALTERSRRDYNKILDSATDYLVLRYHTQELKKIPIVSIYHQIMDINKLFSSLEGELDKNMHDLLTADLYSTEGFEEYCDDFYEKYIESDEYIKEQYGEIYDIFVTLIEPYITIFFDQNSGHVFTIKKFIDQELGCYGDRYTLELQDKNLIEQGLYSLDSIEDINNNTSLVELYRQLDHAVIDEQYEQATKIRDIIHDKVLTLSLEELEVLLQQAKESNITLFIQKIQDALIIKGSQKD